MKTFVFGVVLLWKISLFARGCPFCNEEILCKQVVHETPLTMTLYCLTPMTEGHVLMIPKRHVERFEELLGEELQEIQSEITLLSKIFKSFLGVSDFVILQKNGKNAGQSVAHLHFHMIPTPIPFEEIVRKALTTPQVKISEKEMEKWTRALRHFLQRREPKE